MIVSRCCLFIIFVDVVAALDDSEPLLVVFLLLMLLEHWMIVSRCCFLLGPSAQLQSISLPDPRGFLPTKFGPETLINCTDSRAPQPTRRGSKLRPNRTKMEAFNIFFPSLNIRHTTVSLPALTYFFVQLKLARNCEISEAFREV